MLQGVLCLKSISYQTTPVSTGHNKKIDIMYVSVIFLFISVISAVLSRLHNGGEWWQPADAGRLPGEDSFSGANRKTWRYGGEIYFCLVVSPVW